MYKDKNDAKEDAIFIEESDQCKVCGNSDVCPMLQAFFYGYADLLHDITVRDCGLFKRRAQLRVVK